MSRLRADIVVNKSSYGPFLAAEGMLISNGKQISYDSLTDTTILTGTSLTTTNITANTLVVNQVSLGDNETIYLGDSNDLQIYHNGTNSVIKDNGTGSLFLSGSNSIRITNFDLSEDKAVFNTNGSVELYYDSSKKIETTSTGIAVTGEITSTNGWKGTTSTADVLGGIAMPFVCGINGRISLPSVNATMIFGGSEYSGDNPQGVVMPHNGKLVAATLHAENAVGNLTLSAIVNGVQNTNYQLAFTSPTQANRSDIETWYSSPMNFSAGDRINFAVTTTSLSEMEVLTITFFIKFD